MIWCDYKVGGAYTFFVVFDKAVFSSGKKQQNKHYVLLQYSILPLNTLTRGERCRNSACNLTNPITVNIIGPKACTRSCRTCTFSTWVLLGFCGCTGKLMN